ncbi:MAG TPA: DegQ family serine endoprotease [Blastocatellia bacterium]|nr:DegQ family serine endoprotease [Blastocatellia bacterium]
MMKVKKLNQPFEIRRWVFAASALVLLALGTIIGFLVSANEGTPSSAPFFVTSGNEHLLDQVSFSAGFSPVVKSALPAVVNISASRVVRMPGREFGPLFDDPLFRQFFGEQFNVPRERREHSLGSGVIVNPDGYVLTNSHVVADASDIKILLSDKRELRARVIGEDRKTDVAVLKVDEKNLPALTLGDSSKVQVGEFALAIGNPFGVGQTVTLGIISATGRGGLGIEEYEDFIQTDAAINPGNSGGALINARGELIGINTAIVSRGAMGNQGVGFAVPINLARQVMEQILKQGRVIRGYLGVTVQDVTAPLTKAFGLREARGALVSDAVPGSPAARAGITRGEIITEINGEPVSDSRALRLKIAQMLPGTMVRLKLLRNGKEREVTVSLAELPEEKQPPGKTSERGTALDGVEVADLTAQIARQLGLPPDTRGVVVTDVRPDSPAADAGLRRGDVIQEVNRKPVSSVAELKRAIEQAGKEPVLLFVNRSGNTFFMVIEPR